MSTEPQALPPTTIDSLREELARVQAQLDQYVGYEPTIREEMNHLSEENDLLHKAVAFLVYDALDRPSISILDADIDYMVGRLDIEPDPDRADATRFTYSLPGPGQRAQRKGIRKSIDHRREAERHASKASHVRSLDQMHPIDPVATDWHLRMAMVHATLASGENGAAGGADMRDALTLLRRRETAMRDHVARHIARGLTSKDRDRWWAARSLAQGLDGADANIDNAIDEELADGGNDSKKAWDGSHLPSLPDPWAAKAAAEKADDPWAPDPGVQKIQNFYRIAAAHLVDMLLDPNDLGSKEWARRLTFALQDEGIDLTDAIRARINDTTLGRNPSDPPF